MKEKKASPKKNDYVETQCKSEIVFKKILF